jgi:hypothetical protein
MKRAEIDADQMPGQDSFLDVITNMVGILILLVLVVGLRTQHSVHNNPGAELAEKARGEQQLKEAYNSALSTEHNVRDLVQKVSTARNESAFREDEREWLSTNIAAGEKEIQERRSKLSTGDQRDFDLRHKIATSQAMLDDLTRQQVALMSREPNTEEIECQPTPMAKAVVGTEVHVLLSDDHVAVVPYDELTKQMTSDAKANLWRLTQQDRLEGTIGPVDGFRLRYCYMRERVTGRSVGGTNMTGIGCRFSHCYFLPVVNPAGEPAQEALRQNSDFFQKLGQLRPDGTTITIWTHPGNYERLRELKRAVRQVGFQVAVRPLSKGQPLGAARDGSTSLSE